MNFQDFGANVLPVIMKLFPQLGEKLRGNDELQLAWFRACGKHDAEKCNNALRGMIDGMISQWPEPAMLKSKLNVMGHDEGKPRESMKETIDREAYDRERYNNLQTIAGLSEDELCEHYLVYCASDPFLNWCSQDPMKVPEYHEKDRRRVKTGQMTTAPQVIAAVSVRVASGLLPHDLSQSVKGESGQWEWINVKPEDLERCRQLRAKGIRVAPATGMIGKKADLGKLLGVN